VFAISVGALMKNPKGLHGIKVAGWMCFGSPFRTQRPAFSGLGQGCLAEPTTSGFPKASFHE